MAVFLCSETQVSYVGHEVSGKKQSEVEDVGLGVGGMLRCEQQIPLNSSSDRYTILSDEIRKGSKYVEMDINCIVNFIGHL